MSAPLTTEFLENQVETLSNLGSVCAQSEDSDYLAHLNAPSLAYDLDVVRNLSGLQTLDFYGFAYGSTVGIVYAAMFPHRVGRMMLDGTTPSITSDNSCPELSLANRRHWKRSQF